ncbi:CRAL/TRIO domain-containing protein [Cryptosporidium muris RN66]|uniref:CRAL/TRIO domain-containing protein n=1 Tax=Cryptosporidium muris (strain RN66) TaxID=441375 RepID=B6AAK6_CRYMR|nr:CRAL/TRIO domain-containing protein [Cryptosporidium muris RN66]EEA05247.1 CRAL/TRIO domain-containing protein [Cryptosporidium muris RN66]|eukprot:XP_002139596.1 CRAL/TRIO domain-containing protein [Cryptosporidium muris RN66]
MTGNLKYMGNDIQNLDINMVEKLGRALEITESLDDYTIPSEVLVYNPVDEDVFTKFNTGSSSEFKIRQIFLHVDLLENETKLLDEFDNYCRSNNFEVPMELSPILLRILIFNKRRYPSNYIVKTVHHVKNMYSWRRSIYPLKDTDVELRRDLEDGIIYWHGRDFSLRPILVIKLAKIGKNFPIQRFIRLIVFCLEWGLRYLMIPGKIETCLALIDVRGVSLTSFPISTLSEISSLLTNQYSFRLYKMFVLHDSVFIQAIWNIMKQFLTDLQQHKIVLCRNDIKHQLFKIIHPCQIEEYFGGTEKNKSFPFYPFKFPSNSNIQYSDPRFHPNNGFTRYIIECKNNNKIIPDFRKIKKCHLLFNDENSNGTVRYKGNRKSILWDPIGINYLQKDIYDILGIDLLNNLNEIKDINKHKYLKYNSDQITHHYHTCTSSDLNECCENNEIHEQGYLDKLDHEVNDSLSENNNIDKNFGNNEFSITGITPTSGSNKYYESTSQESNNKDNSNSQVIINDELNNTINKRHFFNSNISFIKEYSIKTISDSSSLTFDDTNSYCSAASNTINNIIISDVINDSLQSFTILSSIERIGADIIRKELVNEISPNSESTAMTSPKYQILNINSNDDLNNISDKETEYISKKDIQQEKRSNSEPSISFSPSIISYSPIDKNNIFDKDKDQKNPNLTNNKVERSIEGTILNDNKQNFNKISKRTKFKRIFNKSLNSGILMWFNNIGKKYNTKSQSCSCTSNNLDQNTQKSLNLERYHGLFGLKSKYFKYHNINHLNK